MPAHVEVLGVSLSYRWQHYKKQIFQDLDVCIEGGDFISVIGCNGSGKTSLLKMILGLQKPDSGQIKVAGEDVDYGYPQAIRDGQIAYISQDIQDMFFSETVAEELEFSGVSLSARSHLGESLEPDRRIRDLSGGERQRLGLQIFTASPAPLLLLDEPTSFLDHQNTEMLRGFLDHAHKDGKTILHLTQYASEVSWGRSVLDLDVSQPAVVHL